MTNSKTKVMLLKLYMIEVKLQDDNYSSKGAAFGANGHFQRLDQ